MHTQDLYWLAHDTERSGPNADVPVIAEALVGYNSLQDALAAWPGYHEATDDEIAAYTEYWDNVHNSTDVRRTAMTRAAILAVFAKKGSHDHQQ